MNLNQSPTPLVVTSGEPAGVGLDVCLGILDTYFDYPIKILADLDVLQERAERLGCSNRLQNSLRNDIQGISFKHMPVQEKVVAGQLNVANVPYVLSLLDEAVSGIKSGKYIGVVTGPIHKGIINTSGLVFTGHTEYFQNKAQIPRVVMMLSDGILNVALATTHLPLKQVAQAINLELILEVVRIIHYEFKVKFKVAQPKIAIAGLNPHAGENGYLGREEIDIIIPAIEQLQNDNIQVSGPYPADTIFQAEVMSQNDVILMMYHDQGLPVIKYASFGRAVNITLGLPYVRTSVDHGTALSLAGSGQADAGSLIQAIKIAQQMI